MPPHSPETREGAAAFSYSIRTRRAAYAARVLRSGGMQGRFATHFLCADAGNPPSQSSGTLRAHPEGAASPPPDAETRYTAVKQPVRASSLATRSLTWV